MNTRKEASMAKQAVRGPVQVSRTWAAKIDLGRAPADGSELKAGTFTAIVSAFGVEDSYGDIVEKGAFSRTIHEWALKERPIPLVWSHDMWDPDSILGTIDHLEETGTGLQIEATLDLDHPKAARIYKLMLAGLITEFSWSGMVRQYEDLPDDDSWWPAMRILDVDLWEAGPCFKGANPATEVLSIKSAAAQLGRATAKAGRILSQANFDTLVSARDLIDEVIAKAKPDEDGDGVPDDEEQDAAEEAGKTTGEAPAEKTGADPAPSTDVQRASAATPRARGLLALAQIH